MLTEFKNLEKNKTQKNKYMHLIIKVNILHK